MNRYKPPLLGRLSMPLAMVLMLAPIATAYASYYGQNNASRGAGCNACHSGGVAPTVILEGPTALDPGVTGTYTLTITGGQNNQVGLGVSVNDGTLGVLTGGTGLRNGELLHRWALPPGAYMFSWTAPATAGTYTIYAAGASVNGNYNATGDAGATTTLDVAVGGGGTGPAPPTGEQLYTDNCAGCHNPIATSAKLGATPQRIQAGIDGDAGGMGALSFLTPEEVLSISIALGGATQGPQAPVANPGGPYTAATGDAVSFNGSASSDADGTIVTYAWDFGDGGTATGATPSHTYTVAGTYDVTLTVTDDSGMTHSATTTASIADGAPPPPDGAALYTANCSNSSCHGPLATSNKIGATATRIQTAINNNTAGMGSLSSLTPEQVQAIADALVPTTAQAPVANTGGPYTGATGQPVSFNGSLSSDLDGVIAGYEWDFGDNSGLMTGATPSHAYTAAGTYTVTLTVTDNTAMTNTATTTATIQDGAPPPLDGAALYENYCGQCHGGTVTSSTKQGRTAQQIQAAIDANPNPYGMGTAALLGLSPEQVQAIADALATGGGGGGGGLPASHTDDQHGAMHAPGKSYPYTNGCSTCHGGALQGGLNNVPPSCTTCHGVEWRESAPPPPSTHTDNQSGALHAPGKNYPYTNGCTGCHGASLQGGVNNYPPSCTTCHGREWRESAPTTGGGTDTGGSTPTTGEGLYSSNCAACHSTNQADPLGTTDKGGRTAQQIQAAIDSNTGNMGYLSNLSSAQVQAIADALATVAPSGPPASHTDSQHGYLHAPGKNYPYSNGCTSCHGSDLRGGVGPSCYSCHSREWRESAPSTSDGDSSYSWWSRYSYGD